MEAIELSEAVIMRVALAQINQRVGDIDANARRVSDAITFARTRGAQVVATPELALTGYPPDDLVLKPAFVAANVDALHEVAREAHGVAAVVGFVEDQGGRLYNAAAVCSGGTVVAVYRKHLLPNYGVFDEQRYFVAGDDHVLFETAEGAFGVSVCEDAWSESGPVVIQGHAGAQLVVNINASPFHKGKFAERAAMLSERARRAHAAIAYVNLVGGQDELVFDGGSMAIDAHGDIVARSAQFEECIDIVDIPLAPTSGREISGIRRLSLEISTTAAETIAPPRAPELSAEAELYAALQLAVHDYVTKNGFDRVVVGLSGGIDSALCAAIAADALGPEHVVCVSMPSEYSTSHSVSDAKELAANLGVHLSDIPIASIYDSYLKALDEAVGRGSAGIAEENLQARIRGNLLMFLSNRDGHLVLATGNKSEGACGYATLYGDMAGGFAPIKDVLKQEVYALARHRNARAPVIPANILTKAPSAELRPDQKDEDALPPYALLDPILEAYIERGASVEDMVEQGFQRAVVEDVVTMVDRAEYKRRQAAPGPKVTVKAFGRDRRLPITNGWRESPRDKALEKVTGPKGDR
jgi:NAD+ synthase (glutamine-hydrolysing)